MERISLKWTADWQDNIMRNICALANTEGGSIVLTLAGGCPDYPDVLYQTIQDLIEENGYGARLTRDSRRTWISIAVKKAENPVKFKDKYYSMFGGRVFDSTAQMEKEIRKEQEKSYWLDTPAEGIHIDDLDWTAIEKFRTLARNNGDDSYSELSDAEVLDNLGLLDEGTPTAAAVLLFHPDPDSVITNSDTRIS